MSTATLPLGVVILDSLSLPLARLQVTAQRLYRGATFSGGREFKGDNATLVPPSAIGRLLLLEEEEIIRRPERWIPKRAAAASIKLRGYVRWHVGGKFQPMPTNRYRGPPMTLAARTLR